MSKAATFGAQKYVRLARDVVFGLILGRLSGLIREGLFVYLIGPTVWLDAFIQFTAFPETANAVIFASAAATLYLPIYQERDQAKAPRGRDPIVSVWNAAALLATIAVAFVASAQTDAAALGVSRSSFVYAALGVIFASHYAASISQTILQHENRPFFAYFSGAVLNFGAIAILFACLAVFSPLTALMIAMVSGNLLRAASMTYVARGGLRRYHWLGLDLSHLRWRHVAPFLGQWAGLCLAGSVVYLMLFIDRVLPSNAAVGYVTFLNLSQRFVQVPFGVLGTVIELVSLKWGLTSGRSAGAKRQIILRIASAAVALAAFAIPACAMLSSQVDSLIACLPVSVRTPTVASVCRMGLVYLPLIVSECCSMFLIRAQGASTGSTALLIFSGFALAIKLGLQHATQTLSSTLGIEAGIVGPLTTSFSSLFLAVAILLSYARKTPRT